MQSDFEFSAGDLDEALQGVRAYDEEEQDLEQELIRAAELEFREFPVTLPGDPLQ
jgi:hypothetical protein